MKKFACSAVMLVLALLMCLSAVSCESVSETPFSKLTDRLTADAGKENTPVDLPPLEKAVKVTAVYLTCADPAYREGRIVLSAKAQGQGVVFHVDILFPEGKDDDGTMRIQYYVRKAKTKNDAEEPTENLVSAFTTLKRADFTGHDSFHFDKVENIPVSYEAGHRQNAGALVNASLSALDAYCRKNLDMSIRDIGLTSLDDRYLYRDPDAPDAEGKPVEKEEDLGGPFSGARWKYIAVRSIEGIGMVFLVLALLWGVLAIFAKCSAAGKKADKAEKVVPPKPDETPVVPESSEPDAAVSVTDDPDPAVVAAITAAVAATIASDEALSSQFESGFRVVSFRKKSGHTSWNHEK